MGFRHWTRSSKDRRWPLCKSCRNGQFLAVAKVGFLASHRFPPSDLLGGVSSTMSGGISTCGIDTAGKAWCWGSNETGAVGGPMP